MKKTILIVVFLLFAALFAAPASAAEASVEQMFGEQLEASGADSLDEELPKEIREQLDDMGISPANGSDFSFSDILGAVADMTAAASGSVVSVFALLTGMIIISAMLERMSESAASSSLRRTSAVVTGVGTYVLISAPIAEYISSAGSSIELCCGFDAVFIPVWSAIAAASGKAASAAEYSLVMLSVLEAASVITVRAVLPLLRVVLAVALTSSLSPSLKLTGAVKLFEKYLKWTLGFAAILVVSVMGISTAAASAVDSITAKAAKFVIANSVPVVGGAMGEALSSVTGCVSLLRTSVGAFGMVAMAFILLPPLIKGTLWSLCMSVCAVIADMLGAAKIRELADAVQSVVSVMCAILIFTGVLTIFTLAVMTGRG